MRLNRFILISLLSATGYFSFCNPAPPLKVESSSPPQFFVHGKGVIDVIQIEGARELPSDDRLSPRFDYWILAPQREMRLEELAKLNPIIYGKVPEGFRQVYPESGEPEPFIEGRTYGFQVMVRNTGGEDVSGVNVVFVLRDGKIIVEDD